jgi:hypothetical protein
MIDLILYFVNPGQRRWQECLGRAGEEPCPDPGDYDDERYYQPAGQYLCLIHLGGDADPLRIRERWSRLSPEVQGRVRWLFVHGSGFPTHLADEGPIHYLRYPLNDRDLRRPSVVGCFQTFLRSLGTGGGFAKPDWRLLYPPDNINLVTASALLSGLKYLDLSAHLAGMTYDEVRTVYSEYVASTRVVGAAPCWNLEEFVAQFRDKHYDALHTELNRVLGAVPD